MKPLHWGEINPLTNTPFLWGDPNLFWGSPSYYLEPGDPGFVPYTTTPTTKKKKKKKRNYMASNPTPDPIDELIAAGEDLHDGAVQHGAAAGLVKNTAAAIRTDLDALINTKAAFKQADSDKVPAYAALRTADSNAKGFIARAINVLKNYLGNQWSDAWVATGLPDNTVGVPTTQDKRFTALGGLKAYFTTNAGHENVPLNVTAAIATTLHGTLSTARNGVANALSNAKAKAMAFAEATADFKLRFRAAINELEDRKTGLGDDDPRWYDFGLNRPADPATPGQPSNVVVSGAGATNVLVIIDGARRANSFNYYKQVMGTDPEPVKVNNVQETQYTVQGLPSGATVQITVTGVNDAGEGPASTPVSVVVP